jgi:hypothetical protein
MTRQTKTNITGTEPKHRGPGCRIVSRKEGPAYFILVALDDLYNKNGQAKLSFSE